MEQKSLRRGAKQLNGSIKSGRITWDGDTSFSGGGGKNSMVGG